MPGAAGSASDSVSDSTPLSRANLSTSSASGSKGNPADSKSGIYPSYSFSSDSIEPPTILCLWLGFGGRLSLVFLLYCVPGTDGFLLFSLTHASPSFRRNPQGSRSRNLSNPIRSDCVAGRRARFRAVWATRRAGAQRLSVPERPGQMSCQHLSGLADFGFSAPKCKGVRPLPSRSFPPFQGPSSPTPALVLSGCL